MESDCILQLEVQSATLALVCAHLSIAFTVLVLLMALMAGSHLLQLFCGLCARVCARATLWLRESLCVFVCFCVSVPFRVLFYVWCVCDLLCVCVCHAEWLLPGTLRSRRPCSSYTLIAAWLTHPRSLFTHEVLCPRLPRRPGMENPPLSPTKDMLRGHRLANRPRHTHTQPCTYTPVTYANMCMVWTC